MNRDIKAIRPEDFLAKLPDGFLESLPESAGAYAVGGSVRDAFLPGVLPRELDLLITHVPPRELLRILSKFGKARLVGKSFSVIKWSPPELEGIDVTIPAIRDLTLENGCQIDPEFPIEEDLGQRDFTVDAMAVDLRTGEFIDPFDGIGDIRNRVLKAVKKNTIDADAVRCIRGAYICIRCDLAPDEITLSQIMSAVPLLKDIAPERIGEELKKALLHLPKPSGAFRLWQKWGILDVVLPELAEGVGVVQEGGWHAHDVFEHALNAVDSAPMDLEIRLAALFHDIGKPRRKKFDFDRDKATFYGHQNIGEKMSREILDRLKFPKDTIDRVARMVRFHMFTHCETDKGIRRFIRNVGEELIEPLFELRYADVEAQGTGRCDEKDREYFDCIQRILSEKPAISIAHLAVNGTDVMQYLGICEGPDVGKALEYLLDRVIDEPELNEREKLFELLSTYLWKRDELRKIHYNRR